MPLRSHKRSVCGVRPTSFANSRGGYMVSMTIYYHVLSYNLSTNHSSAGWQSIFRCFSGAILIGAEETLSVEVNEVTWCVRNPDLGFPSDFREVFHHCSAINKRSDKDQSRLSPFEQGFEFVVSFNVNGAMTGDRLNENEPVLFRIVDNNIWHFPMLGD